GDRILSGSVDPTLQLPSLADRVVDDDVDLFVGRPSCSCERDGRARLVVGLVARDRRAGCARKERGGSSETPNQKESGADGADEDHACPEAYSRTVLTAHVLCPSQGHVGCRERSPPLISLSIANATMGLVDRGWRLPGRVTYSDKSIYPPKQVTVRRPTPERSLHG